MILTKIMPLLLDTKLRCQSVTNREFPSDAQRQIALFTFGKYGDSPPEEGAWLVPNTKNEILANFQIIPVAPIHNGCLQVIYQIKA